MLITCLYLLLQSVNIAMAVWILFLAHRTHKFYTVHVLLAIIIIVAYGYEMSREVLRLAGHEPPLFAFRQQMVNIMHWLSGTLHMNVYVTYKKHRCESLECRLCTRKHAHRSVA